MPARWSRLNANLDRHPLLDGCRWETLVTLVTLVRVTEEAGERGGVCPAHYASPTYLARRAGAGLDAAVVETGMTDLHERGVVAFEEASGTTRITIWQEFRPDPTSAERQAGKRERYRSHKSHRDSRDMPESRYGTGRDGTGRTPDESPSGTLSGDGPTPPAPPVGVAGADLFGAPDPPPPEFDDAEVVLAAMNRACDRQFEPTANTLAPIRARLRQKRSVAECVAVVLHAHKEVGEDLTWAPKILRPSTLFRPGKFDERLALARQRGFVPRAEEYVQNMLDGVRARAKGGDDGDAA